MLSGERKEWFQCNRIGHTTAPIEIGLNGAVILTLCAPTIDAMDDDIVLPCTDYMSRAIAELTSCLPTVRLELRNTDPVRLKALAKWRRYRALA